jgi:phage terminase large subunit-like protein
MIEGGYDLNHAYPIMSSLAEDMPDQWADAGQSYRHMNGACKELERMVLERRIAHGGNAVARWMAGNVVAEQNQDDLIRPSRKRSNEKIDGLVSLLFCIQRLLVAEAQPVACIF